MIKVIKHGKKIFKAACPICGCEFEYEYEDLSTESGFVKMVKCPDCGEMIYHNDYKWPKYPDPYIPDNPIVKPYITWDVDCAKCPNYHYQKENVVGDTPCTFCKKNQPYCVNLVSSEKLDFKTPAYDKNCQTIYSSYVDSNIKTEEHKND